MTAEARVEVSLRPLNRRLVDEQKFSAPSTLLGKLFSNEAFAVVRAFAPVPLVWLVAVAPIKPVPPVIWESETPEPSESAKT